MICQRCKKHKATVHVTDLVQNENRDLCEQCAVEEGVTFKQHTPINELLTNFMMTQAGAQEVVDLTCDACGISFQDVRSNGLLGCPNDYEVFADVLAPLIARAQHEGGHHVGKVPSSAGQGVKRAHDLMRLRRDLATAVEREDYEAAAGLRDEIKQSESSA